MRSFRVSKQTLYLMLLLIGGIATLLSAQSDDSLYILSPIVIATLICGWFLMTLWKRDGEFPTLDIGVFCVLFTALYIAIPLLNFYFGGLSFGPLSDGRLQSHSPSAAELGLFFINHIVYLASLASTYLVFRKPNGNLHQLRLIPPSPSLVKVLVVGYLIGSLYFFVLHFAFGIGFKSGYGDEMHILAGPLWLQQINGKLAGIHYIFYSSMLALLILNKNNWKFRYFIFLLIAWEITSAFIQPGSRGELISLILLSVLYWHKFHRVNFRLLIIMLSFAFLCFMFFGLYRSFANLGDMVSFIDSFPIIASASNEFQAMLGTAFDVKLIERDVKVPLILFFNDFMPLLPPQQLLPFDKLTGADWYLMQINQEGTGGGFMWSVISQSLIGFGLGELVLRGAILGWILAFIHKWYQRRYIKFLPSVIYIMLCLGTVMTFRDTTGSIFWEIWWAVIPFTFLLYILGFRSMWTPFNSQNFHQHLPTVTTVRLQQIEARNAG